MDNNMNVVDAMMMVQRAAVAEMPNMPMTLGSIQPFIRGDGPVGLVNFQFEIVGSRRRYPVSIEVAIEDGRVAESVSSMTSRLIHTINETVGLRRP